MKSILSIKFIVLTLLLLGIAGNIISAQQKKATAEKWVKVSEDDAVAIYYNANMTTDRSGNHIVWVKAVYSAEAWQRYFADMIGSRTLVQTTKTKAKYDKDYNYVMVRQVLCYSKAGKLLHNTGDDSSAGWGIVNASDPVGIVGEYLEYQQRKPY
jgi:hypothetical protein